MPSGFFAPFYKKWRDLNCDSKLSSVHDVANTKWSRSERKEFVQLRANSFM